MTTCPRCLAGTSTCGRCGRALCLDHVNVDERCNDCELAYYESRDRLRLNAWFALGASAPWAVLATQWAALAEMRPVGGFRALTTGIPLLDAIVVAGFTSVFLGKGLIGVRTWLHRRRFFAPRRALLSRSVA